MSEYVLLQIALEVPSIMLAKTGGGGGDWLWMLPGWMVLEGSCSFDFD